MRPTWLGHNRIRRQRHLGDRPANPGRPTSGCSPTSAPAPIDAVVAWDLDRLYRQPRELEDLIDLADQKHLALATVGGDADLSTDNGRLFARIKGAVAKSETERKCARQKRANKQRAEAGRPGRSTVPFGYRQPTAMRWCSSPPKR